MASVSDYYPTNGGPRQYRARWRTPDGKSRSKNFARQADALAFIREIEADKTRGEFIEPTRRTVAEAVLDWLENGVNADEEASIRNYVSIAKYVLEPTWPGTDERRVHHIGNVKLTDLGPKHIEPFLGEIGRERSQSTLNKVKTILNQTLNREVRHGSIRSNPLATIGRDLPRSKKKIESKIALTREECRRLVTEAHKFEEETGTMVQVALAIELMSGTGLRISEALGLVGRNLNPLRRTLTVEASLKAYSGTLGKVKSGASARTVQISSSLASRLAGLVTGPEEPIFRAELGGWCKYSNFYNRQFKPVVKRALPEKADLIGTHTFRRSHITHLVEAGMNPKKIQARMGHENSSITMDTYAKAMGGFSADEVESFDLFGFESEVAA